MRQFHVWSIFFFIPPLALALYLQLFIPAAILVGVIITSLAFHLSKERHLMRIDKLLAWTLIISNLVLIALSNFRMPYALLAVATVPVALLFFYASRSAPYDHTHGWWHIASSLITVFSLLTLQT